ncbi:MAG: PAS domain S-box protein [Nitrospinae bacterium]|nr:PAS domain S-box protein [Nitrospinota bacterium]
MGELVNTVFTALGGVPPDLFAPGAANHADTIAAGYYDPSLVVLSYLIATITSYVALFLSARASGLKSPSMRRSLLLVGGASMGGGIFSMHFIGMIAFHLPMAVHYDPGLTILSLLIAVSGALYALSTVSRGYLKPRQMLLNGTVMGLVIAAMHYVGMAAMRLEAAIRYRPGLFAFSLVIAITAATAALWLMRSFKEEIVGGKQQLMWGSAALMGLAVCGMHYTGMAAAIYYPLPGGEAPPHAGMPHDMLTLLVTGVIVVILCLAVIFAFQLEIVERRRAEEELRRLATAIEHTAQTVIITDAAGNIIYANPAFEKITGYTVVEAIGKTPRFLKSGRQTPDFYTHLWQTITAGRTWEGILVNRKKNGALYEERASISPIVNGDGTVVSFVALKSDITMENALRRIKDRISAVISHELCTPLAELQLAGFLAASLEGGNGAPTSLAKLQAAIKGSFTDFERIATDTSLFTSLSMPKERTVFTAFFLHPLILSCVANAREMMKRENRFLTLEPDVDAIDVSFQMTGNDNMVVQAVNRVLSNAIKYTPDGKMIRIAANIGPEGVVLTIRDEGSGIPPERLEMIFEPYYSLDDPLKHSTSQYAFRGGGIGLGLSITRLIMDYHGGLLTVESEGGEKGTIVKLTFPRERIASPFVKDGDAYNIGQVIAT